MLKLRVALLAPYPYWMLIVAVVAVPTTLIVSVSRDFLMLGWICTVLLKIFLFGRILSQVLPDRVSRFSDILKEYGGHYLVAAILVGLIAIAVRMVISGETTPRAPYSLVNGVARGLVAAVAIYIWPLVFLKRSSIGAIVAGFSELKGTFVSSLWIVAIVLVGEAILALGQLLYMDHRSGWSFVVLLIAGAVYIYLDAAAYAAALYKLLRVRIIEPTVEG